MERFWVPLCILTVAGFTFNTSELIPIGLLSDIAGSFGVSEARSGMLITVYAWVVALMSLPLMLLFARMEYRRLMLGVVGVFVVSHIATVLSTGYYSLMVSRIGVALAHSLFWSIAPAMAVAVAPESRRATALSALVAGGGVALVAGLPLGRVLGIVAGWRMTFAALGVLAFLVLMGLWLKFPTIEKGEESESRRDMLRDLVRCKPLIAIYIITAMMVTGHYTGYSYVEPFLLQVAAMPAGVVTVTLSLFGFAGLAGSYIISRYYGRYSRALITGACFGLPAMMAMLLPVTYAAPLLISCVCVAWGLCMTVYNIAFQNEIVTLFPRDSAVPMSLYSGIFNLGIGAGAFVGGVVSDHGMMSDIGYIGGVIALAAAVYCYLRYMPLRKGDFGGRVIHAEN